MGKNVIIVGSGIGGLASGLLLAHAGHKVTIFEKNGIPGGRLSSYEKEGFKLDFGVHVISRGIKGPVGDVLRRVGIDNALEFTSVRPLTNFNGKSFRFPYDLKELIPEEDFNGLMNFMKDIKSFTPEQVEAVDYISAKELLNNYTKNELVHTFVSRIGSVYCALPAWEISAGEFIRCMNWEASYRSSGYPQGGCIAITNAYLEGIVKFGGEYHLNCPVEKIIVEDNRAVGVVAGGKEYRADVVVCNADLQASVLKLIGKEYFSPEYVETVENLKFSLGCPTFRIALDEKVTDIKMLSSFGKDGVNQEVYFDKLRRGIMPDALNLFVVVPSNFAPDVAPEGRQLISVALSMPDTLETIIPNLREHIMWIDYMSIDFMERYAGEKGCIIGVGQSSSQVGKYRPAIKSPVDGLYFVSSEAGGQGVGIELAINSAIEFFDKYGCNL